VVVAAGVVRGSEDVEASFWNMLAAVLEVNQEMAWLVAELCEENARLWAEDARQAAELESLRVDLAVFQWMLFGRSSERSCPEPDSRDGDAGRGGERQDGPGGSGKKRGPGARAGRRDYSHLPRS
jgi:transposase